MGLTTRHPLTCVAAFVVDGSGRVLIGNRVKDAIPSLPGGKVDWAEAAHVGLAREVFEETGLIVEPGRLLGYTDDMWPEDDLHFVTLYFRCTVIGGELTVREPTKIDSFQWVAPSMMPPLYAGCEKFLKLL